MTESMVVRDQPYCGKTGYRIRRIAEEVARFYVKRVYECPQCGWFHLTSHLEAE